MKKKDFENLSGNEGVRVVDHKLYFIKNIDLKNGVLEIYDDDDNVTSHHSYENIDVVTRKSKLTDKQKNSVVVVNNLNITQK